MSRRTSLGAMGVENAGGNVKGNMMPAVSKRMSMGASRMSIVPGMGSKRMSMGLGMGARKESIAPRYEMKANTNSHFIREVFYVSKYFMCLFNIFSSFVLIFVFLPTENQASPEGAP